MSRGRIYGKTWWGKAWVDALQRIDLYTNRLPRGRTYANTGKVKDIIIDDNGMVKAKVQGRRSSPYRVEITLTHFTAKERKTIKEAIAQDPALAAELSLGRLPASILQLMESKKIPLLPKTWDSISGSCSCPDWANPCKHLAAVYYIMASEIDKDPFILFQLRGMKTKDLLQAADFMPIPAAYEQGEGTYASVCKGAANLNFITYSELKCEDKGSQQNSRDIDLSFLIEEQDSKALFALLRESPLFYPTGNFKSILLKAYKNIASAVEKQEVLDNDISFKGADFRLFYPSSKSPPNFSNCQFFTSPLEICREFSCEDKEEEKVKAKGNSKLIPVWKGEAAALKRIKGKTLPAAAVLDRFLTLPQKLSEEKSSPGTDFLSGVVALARM